MVEVTLVDASVPLGSERFEALLSWVSPAKRARIARFRLARDAQNCLLADVLARREIARRTGLDARGLTFWANPWGKPALVPAGTPSVPGCAVQFNVSHTGTWVVCATSQAPVGIDIELVVPIDAGVVRRFFAPDEAAYVFAGDVQHRFAEIWTKKEARIKWSGQGLSIPLPSFSVLASDPGGLVYHRVRPDAAEFCCHVCTDRPDAPSIQTLTGSALAETALEDAVLGQQRGQHGA